MNIWTEKRRSYVMIEVNGQKEAIPDRRSYQFAEDIEAHGRVWTVVLFAIFLIALSMVPYDQPRENHEIRSSESLRYSEPDTRAPFAYIDEVPVRRLD